MTARQNLVVVRKIQDKPIRKRSDFPKAVNEDVPAPIARTVKVVKWEAIVEEL